MRDNKLESNNNTKLLFHFPSFFSRMCLHKLFSVYGRRGNVSLTHLQAPCGVGSGMFIMLAE